MVSRIKSWGGGGGAPKRTTGRCEANQWLCGYVSSCIMRIGCDPKAVTIADPATAVKRVSSGTSGISRIGEAPKAVTIADAATAVKPPPASRGVLLAPRASAAGDHLVNEDFLDRFPGLVRLILLDLAGRPTFSLSSEWEVDNLVCPVLRTAALHDEKHFINRVRDRHAGVDDEDSRHRLSFRYPVKGEPRHGAPIVREQDPPVIGRPTQYRLIVGPLQSDVLHAYQVDGRQSPDQAAHDVVVEVLVTQQAEQFRSPSAR